MTHLPKDLNDWLSQETKPITNVLSYDEALAFERNMEVGEYATIRIDFGEGIIRDTYIKRYSEHSWVTRPANREF